MKVIILFMTIIIGVNGNLVDDLRNANVSMATLHECTTLGYGFMLYDEHNLTHQWQCCFWSDFVKRTQEENLEPCRPLLTTSIESLENVMKISCESRHFHYGCPYQFFFNISKSFLSLIGLTSTGVVFHRLRSPHDLGGRPLTKMFLSLVNISIMLYFMIIAAAFYYLYLSTIYDISNE